jgi:ABC-type multidrug transport system fused ATPase/permease subunit
MQIFRGKKTIIIKLAGIAVAGIILIVYNYGLPVIIASSVLFLFLYVNTMMLATRRVNLVRTKAALDREAADISKGIGVIKHFKREDLEIKRYTERADAYAEDLFRFDTRKRGRVVFTGLILGISAAVVPISSAYRMMSGGPGTEPDPLVKIIICTAAAIAVPLLIVFLFAKTPKTEEAKNPAETLPKPVKDFGKIDTVPGDGKITLSGVRYTYPNTDKPAIDGISLEIRAGERFGIAGQTNSGKTTLINLIMRHMDVSDGSIYIDGVDVKDYSESGLKAVFAEKISITDGDETLSAGGKTVIIASQKISDVKGCERIAFLAGGQLEAIGTHEALLQNSPLYRAVVNAEIPGEVLPEIATETRFGDVLGEAESQE